MKLPHSPFPAAKPQKPRERLKCRGSNLEPRHFKISHLFSTLQYEIIHTDLNRRVGIIGMRREDFALVTGSDFRHHLILYEENV